MKSILSVGNDKYKGYTCFHLEIRKIIFELSPSPPLIWNSNDTTKPQSRITHQSMKFINVIQLKSHHNYIIVIFQTFDQLKHKDIGQLHWRMIALV